MGLVEEFVLRSEIITILFSMKPTISFVLQLSPSTDYNSLDAVARNLADGLDIMLNSGLVRCSLFLDGPTIETLRKVAKPLVLGKVKDAVADGVLEFLGGGFYDPMLPLFPEETQSMQLDMHRRLLKKNFEVEPQGFFNSSLVWEMGMTAVLQRAGFDYALVSEAAIRDALGRTTPVSGWYTVEDKGSLMRIVPVADALSKAIEDDDINWNTIAEPYCRGGKSAVVLFDMPPDPKDIVAFFERLVDFVETNGVQTWPVGYSVNQLAPEGSLSYLMSSGRKLGLPSTVTTCREMLLLRPEINLHQKMFLNLYNRGKAVLDSKRFNEFCEKLLPAMSPIFFRDLGDGGMRELSVRGWGARYLLEASKLLADQTDFSGLRMEVCDFLLQGRKQIYVENSEISCLLDYFAGGVLRSYNSKQVCTNLVNAWRDDGEPVMAFLDCLLPNVDLTPVQIETALDSREFLLNNPYDYQIVRGEGGAQVQLLEEQVFTVGDKQGVFHVGKDFDFKNASSEITVTYKVTNSLYMESKSFFGSIFELGMLEHSDGIGVTIDGNAVKWNKKDPFVYPEARKLDVRDYALGCTFHMVFDTPASVFVGAVFGASTSAAPDVFQGIRIYPFWRTALNVMDEKKFGITVSVTKR